MNNLNFVKSQTYIFVNMRVLLGIFIKKLQSKDLTLIRKQLNSLSKSECLPNIKNRLYFTSKQVHQAAVNKAVVRQQVQSVDQEIPVCPLVHS